MIYAIGDRQVLQLCLETRETALDLGIQTVFLRGNHEQMLLEARDAEPSSGPGGPVLNWMTQGGRETLASYGTMHADWTAIPHKHWTFMEQTLIQHLTDQYHFVHAGLVPADCSWTSPDIDPHLWIHEPFLSCGDDFEGRIVVFVHTPQRSRKPLLHHNKIGLDTAACAPDGKLTCACLPTLAEFDLDVEFLQVGKESR